ncbi:MAG: histidine phosphatase family protein [Faecousia sp.]
MRLLLIRHGITEANARRLYCGSTDLPLLPAGEAALEGKAYPLLPRLVTSGMKRADQTMERLFPGAPYERIPALEEIHFGAFEMKSYRELKDDPAYQQWISGDNGKNRCPGGESGEEAQRRAMAALYRLIADGVDTAVVTHGGIIAGAMAQWFPGEGKNRYEWQPAPGNGYLITVEHGIPLRYEEK